MENKSEKVVYNITLTDESNEEITIMNRFFELIFCREIPLKIIFFLIDYLVLVWTK